MRQMGVSFNWSYKDNDRVKECYTLCIGDDKKDMFILMEDDNNKTICAGRINPADAITMSKAIKSLAKRLLKGDE